MNKPRRRVKRYAAMHKEALESRIRAEREANLRDIADDLATALRDLLRYHDACGVESGTGDAARTVLRRYDSRRSIDAD